MLTTADGYAKSAFVEGIEIPERLRPLNEERVQGLIQSIQTLGLRTPITVRDENDGERVILVAGRHRLEAARRLGWDDILVIFVEGDADDFRLWEIAENLHRSELTPLERSEHIAEWIRLTEAKEIGKPGQLAQVSKGGRGKKAGLSAATERIGVERTDARRAVKIDSISPEAKQAAREAGIDKNQSALLKVAAAPVEHQVEAVKECAKPRPPAPARAKEAAREPAPFDDAEIAAVDLLKELLGDNFGTFRDMMREVSAQRFWEALTAG